MQLMLPGKTVQWLKSGRVCAWQKSLPTLSFGWSYSDSSVIILLNVDSCESRVCLVYCMYLYVTGVSSDQDRWRT